MIYDFADCELDVDRHELRRAGERQTVEPQVFDILVHLLRNRARMVTRDALLDAVWGHRFVSSSAVDSRIRSARQAVGDDGRRQAIIRTVRGRGFHFVADVRERGTPPGPVIAAPTTVPATVPAASSAESPLPRPDEQQLLTERLADALAGQRRVVLVAGEPGIGKSTLVQLFLEAVEPPVCVARGQCVEQRGEAEPFLPILDALARLHRDRPDAGVPTVLERWAPALLLRMPGLVEPSDRAALAGAAAGVTHRHMLRQAVEALEALSRATPLVLVLEDLHWSDPSTLDLLAWLADRPEPCRLLVLGTFRPAEPGSDAHSGLQRLRRSAAASSIMLHGFDRAGMERLIGSRFPGARLPDLLSRLVVARTCGNPLFARSLLDAWVESGALSRRDGAWTLTQPPAELAGSVPETLRESLQTRLARLPASERRALAAASVAGVECTVALVAAALGRPEDVIEDCLHRVSRRGWILHPAGEVVWPDGTASSRFAFDHQVHREVVYAQLSPARRRSSHRAIGLRLEAAFDGAPENHAAELAHHFTESRDAARAVGYLRTAAARALEQSAHEEAARSAGTALSLLRRMRLPDSAERELDLLMLHAAALLETRGWADPEPARAYERACDLAVELGDEDRLGDVLYALAYVHETRGDYDRALGFVERGLALAERRPDPVARIEANDLLSCSLLHQGRFADAIAAADRAIAIASTDGFVPRPSPFGHHPLVSSHYWAGLCQWLLGRPDSGAERVLQAVRIADGLGHAASRAFARTRAARICCFRREPAEAATHASVAIALADAHDLLYQRSTALALLGWARALLGEPEAGVRAALEGLALQESLGATMDRPFTLCLLADARLADGRPDLAIAAVDEARAALGSLANSFFWSSEMERIRAAALHRTGRTDAALETLATAIAIAGRQQAVLLDVRARTDLCRMLPSGTRRQRELAALRRLRKSLDEGADTSDIREADEVLRGA